MTPSGLPALAFSVAGAMRDEGVSRALRRLDTARAARAAQYNRVANQKASGSVDAIRTSGSMDPPPRLDTLLATTRHRIITKPTNTARRALAASPAARGRSPPGPGSAMKAASDDPGGGIGGVHSSHRGWCDEAGGSSGGSPVELGRGVRRAAASAAASAAARAPTAPTTAKAAKAWISDDLGGRRTAPSASSASRNHRKPRAVGFGRDATTTNTAKATGAATRSHSHQLLWSSPTPTARAAPNNARYDSDATILAVDTGPNGTERSRPPPENRRSVCPQGMRPSSRTVSRSSTSSATVASIRWRDSAPWDSPSTTDHSPPLVVTGNDDRSPSGTP